uniref:Copia protein n=1 Tax=Cajanus cajan TaxID=3821 RepID=A0A151T6F6_CAJCA|nr:Copia protein [Cajanus cajan]
MIIAEDDKIEKLALKEKLAAQFEMKDLGKLKYFLGIEVAYSKNGIFISQSEESAPVEKAQYQRLVGKLIYLSHTRPDIAYAISILSQFMHDPRERHMQAVDKILPYLKSSPGKGLLFKREDTLTMKIYTDADYAGSITDRISTFGYCMFLGDSLVTWRSKKQDKVSCSSAEAKFRALAQGMCEGLWMKIILDDLKVKVDNPVQLYCDNKSVMSIAHNPVQHDRIKHIEIDRHFIKDNLDRGFVITTHVPTELQIADSFTKGLPQGRFQDLVSKLGMIDIHLPT